MISTVVKVTKVMAVCTKCHHSRPYVEGYEKKPCPACSYEPRHWTNKT